MQELLDLLIATAWRGAPLMAIALLVVVTMRRASAAARHAVLALAIAAHLAVPVVLSIGVQVDLPQRYARSDAIDLGGSATPLDAPWLTEAGSASAQSTTPIAVRGGSSTIVVLVWLAVATFLIARYVTGLVQISRRRARGMRARPDMRGASVPEGCAVLYADVSVPCACGLLRPAILLPRAAASWTPERLRMVLLHEAAHVRRRDVAIQGAAQLLCALFWFDPLVRVVRARLQGEAELAADDAVLRAGTDAPAYVLELVALVRSARSQRAQLAAVGLGRNLTVRAGRALRGSVARDALGPRRAAALGVLAGVITLLAGATFERTGAAPRELVTGCAWSDGRRHVNRWTDAGGDTRWEVAWQGDDCAVSFVARPGAVLVDGALTPADAGSITVTLERGAARDTLELTRERDRLVLTSSGGIRADASWLRAFAEEIALHTGFDARERVAAILAAGSADDVLALARRAQGDHASGVYLLELVRTADLDERQVQRVLATAAANLSNDAVMTELLTDVARRHRIPEAGPLRAAFDAAAARLTARAARESIRSL